MKVSVSIISVLCLCNLTVSALNTFPVKFEAHKKYSNLSVRCNKATERPVKWLHDGEELDSGDGVEFQGDSVTIQRFNEELTGNLTCLSDGKELDYTYLLMDKSNTITGSPVSCTAETFNCTSTISCKINQKGYQYFRLRDERNAKGWLSPSANGKFSLTHTTNPFAEEAKPIVVLAEGVSTVNNYFQTKYSFYIRDIIKPGCPHISVSRNELNLSPPATWTLPLTYYPLEHQIEFQRRSDGKIMSTNIAQPNNMDLAGGRITIPKGTSKLRARCRDPLLASEWSEWTVWQNVGKRRPKKDKKKDKKKNQFDYKSR